MAVSVNVADAVAVTVGAVGVEGVGAAEDVVPPTVGDTAAIGGDVGVAPQLAMLPAMMTNSKSATIARVPLAHRRT